MDIINRQNQAGFIGWHFLVAGLVIGVVGFVGGSVYTAQQKASKANQAVVSEDKKDASKIATVQKDTSETQKPVEIPAEKAVVEPVPQPKPAPAPAPIKPAPAPTPVKKDPSMVGVTAASQVGADSVVLTVSFPATYSGTCKALVKHMDGSNHMWLENSFSSANNCSITVPRSSLTSTMAWQYYMYFNSSDYTVKGDSGKHTFSL